MKRILVSALVALITLGGLFWPLAEQFDNSGSSTSPDPVTITNYRADYAISADGGLEAVETITAEFPYGRHGIFRFWDLTDRSDKRVRYVPKKIAVTLDGSKEPSSLSWETGKRYRVAKIGDPDRYVSPGTHTYTISYRIKGVLSPTNAGTGSDGSSSWAGQEKGHSLFLWDVVPGGWQMDIAKSTTTINLPKPSGDLKCASSAQGQSFPCTIDGKGTRTVTVTTGALPPRVPVSVLVDVPVTTPHRHTLPWGIASDVVFGRSVIIAILLFALSLVGLVVGYLWERRTREPEPGFPVMYEPPAGLGPVQTAYVATERVPGKALTSTLLYQAEQGLTKLTDNGDNHWDIVGTGTPDQWAKTDAVTRSVGEALGLTTAGGTFAADGSVSSGSTLQSLQGSIGSTVRDWATTSEVIVPVGSERFGRVAVITAMVLGAAGLIFNPFQVSLMGLPFAAFAIGGAGMLLAGVGTRRTTAGRDIWSRAGGFERLLSTTSNKERLDFSARKELYTSFIPFAVAFDCADRWANKYKVQTGQEPPSPMWFGGVAGSSSGSGFSGGPSFSSFESSLSSSIGAYQATQSSSSSGGGGGGFGGGGGGGGGGSW